MAFGLAKRISPEYVLGKAFLDMKKNGLDGLKPYLTASALKKIELIQTVSSGMGMFSKISPNSGEDTNAPTKFLLEKLSECEWSIKDLLKGSTGTKAVIGFNYEDRLVGTIDLSMIKEDKEWRIDNLSLPHFDKIDIGGIVN